MLARRARAVPWPSLGRLAVTLLLVPAGGTCCAGAAAPADSAEAPSVGDAPAPLVVPAEDPASPPPFVEIVLRKGDVPAGGGGLPIASLGIASTDGLGRLGFAGTLAAAGGPEVFVWKDGAVIWRASEVDGPAPATASPMAGIGDAGDFVLRSAMAQKDTVWSRAGRLVTGGGPAPGIAGATIVLSNWTTMTPDGTAYWLSEFRDGPGSRGRGRALYRSPGASPDSIEVVLRSDDLVDGVPLARPFGLDFNYMVSDDQAHVIQVAQLATGSTADDDIVYVDGHAALREGDPSNLGPPWQRFRRVAINDRGDYLVAGELDAPHAKDSFLALNGEIVLIEGEAVGGRELATQATVLAASLDNQGRALHLWSVGGFGAQYLFFACDANQLEESQLLLSSHQRLPFADPGLAMTIEGFNGVGHGPILWLGPGDRAYVGVDLVERVQPPPPPLEAILSIPLPACPLQAGG